MLLASASLLASGVLAAESPNATPAKPTGFIGESVTLQQEGKAFSGLYADVTINTKKAARRRATLLVPDLGAPADAREIIEPLRTQLPRAGWATLSLELPALTPGSPRSAYGSTIAEAVKRVQTGVEFLASKGAESIIVIGHGIGAVVVVKYLSATPDPKVAGFAAVGLHLAADIEPPVDLLADLATLGVPMLDLYGGRDIDSVRASAEARRAVFLKAQKVTYTRVEIKDARPGFRGLEAFLVNRIRGWMDRTAAQREALLPQPLPSGQM
jgi:pimeloyl-ACP methyl ester carboxylesterase